jgi:hypothetical protein
MTKTLVAGGNPNVIAEARAKRKRGGGVCAAPDGDKAKGRMDKPRRASGGGVGSNKNPFSSARAVVKG